MADAPNPLPVLGGDNGIVTVLFGALAGAVPGFISWFSGRRKASAEAKTRELANDNTAIETMRGILLDARLEIERKDEEILGLHRKIAELEKPPFRGAFQRDDSNPD